MAKILARANGIANHPYCIKNDELKVYGWVDAVDITDFVAPVNNQSINNKPTSNPNFVVGKTKVKVKTGALNFDTKKSLATFVYQMTFDVIESAGDRIVIGVNGVVTAPINANDLTIVSGSSAVTSPAPSTSNIIPNKTKVKVKSGAKNYDTGKLLAAFVYTMKFDVIESKNGRVVIGLNGVVTAPVNEKDLIKV
jgi:hypothetical protein